MDSTDHSKGQTPVLRTPLTLHFEGPAFARRRLSARDLVGFVSHLQTAVDRVALMLQGEDGSVLRGRRPAEIENECALDVVSLAGGGSVTVVCDLPAVSQQRLPGYADIGQVALETLVGGLDELGSDVHSLPRGFDKGVLLSLRELGKPFEKGEGKLSIELRVGRRRISREFTRRTYDHIVKRIQQPVKNRREVEGRLLMADFKETALRCRVHPPTGPPILCEFDEAQRDAILSAMTHYVRVIGEATEIEEEVKLLRIEDVEVMDGGILPPLVTLAPSASGPKLPTLDDLASAYGAKPIQDPSALAGDFWPDDESVEEFLRTLRKWRREKSEGSSS